MYYIWLSISKSFVYLSKHVIFPSTDTGNEHITWLCTMTVHKTHLTPPPPPTTFVFIVYRRIVTCVYFNNQSADQFLIWLMVYGNEIVAYKVQKKQATPTTKPPMHVMMCTVLWSWHMHMSSLHIAKYLLNSMKVVLKEWCHEYLYIEDHDLPTQLLFFIDKP